jgi:hypothetical protein
MRFNFQFGKKQRSVWDYALWSIILFSFISMASIVFKVDEKTLWRLLDQIQRELIKLDLLPQDNVINDLIIGTPELLDNRVKNDVDDAIRSYEESLPPETPRMTNKTILEALESPKFSETQRLVVKDAIYYECPGGVMGIRGAWVDKDPECN